MGMYMASSMTGFGRYELEKEFGRITVEMKSVNHRYCDITIKLPRKFMWMEPKLRGLLKNYIDRGKLDVYVTYEELADAAGTLAYNRQRAKEYYDMLQLITADLELRPIEVSPTTIARFPEVITVNEPEIEDAWVEEAFTQAVEEAAVVFKQSRAVEGEKLTADIMEKLTLIEQRVDAIEKRSPEVVADYREKLYSKVRELLGNKELNEAALATEVTIFADKICVDEETVRLRSHITNMRDTFAMPGAIGRKLDFLAQEMNREANTTLSKANDTEISNIAIDLKTEIEKIREQIQNIE